MLERIPQRIDHYRYTDKGVILDGVITQEESEKDLLRLNEAIIKITDGINYHLQFDLDKAGNRIVTGTVNTQVILQCQRCMENYALELECDVSIAFVSNEFEQKKAESSLYDIFWLDKKELFDPRVLIEDELLLALPQIPMHSAQYQGTESDQTCQIQLDYPVNEVLPEDLNKENLTKNNGQMDENNPFAVLQQLKK